jgi:hypothetical protein
MSATSNTVTVEVKHCCELCGDSYAEEVDWSPGHWLCPVCYEMAEDSDIGEELFQ